MMVSVIITTYNRSDFLRHAIQSVVDQSYKEIEIIVIDDASSCDNQSVIDKFNQEILYYRFDTNKGANVCRNKGAELANYKYIAYLDDDDQWVEDKIENQLKFMENNSVDLSYTGKYIITLDDQYQELSKRYSFWVPKSKNLEKEIMKKNFIGTTSSIMLQRDKFLQIGGFDINLPALQDYEFYIRFIFQGFSIKGINKPLVNYYIYQNENAISKSSKKNLDAKKQILIKHRNKKYLYYLSLMYPKGMVINILKRYI